MNGTNMHARIMAIDSRPWGAASQRAGRHMGDPCCRRQQGRHTQADTTTDRLRTRINGRRQGNLLHQQHGDHENRWRHGTYNTKPDNVAFDMHTAINTKSQPDRDTDEQELRDAEKGQRFVARQTCLQVHQCVRVRQWV